MISTIWNDEDAGDDEDAGGDKDDEDVGGDEEGDDENLTRRDRLDTLVLGPVGSGSEGLVTNP